MEISKKLFHLYQLTLSLLCAIYLYSVIVRIGEYELYWYNLFPYIIISLFTIPLCGSHAIVALIGKPKFLIASPSFASTSYILTIIATIFFAYLMVVGCPMAQKWNSYSNSEAGQTNLRTMVGQQAPDFSGKDQNGNPISLKSFPNKYILLHFWASWCGPCRKEIPRLKEIGKEYEGNNLIILGVSLDHNIRDFKNYVNHANLQNPEVFDQGSRISMTYGIDTIPATFLINPQGQIIRKNLREDTLRELYNICK